MHRIAYKKLGINNFAMQVEPTCIIINFDTEKNDFMISLKYKQEDNL